MINHWSHEQHPLILRNKFASRDNQFVIRDNDSIKICDGCSNPIYSREVYFECHPCKYFLHRYCGELPKQMQSQSYGQHVILPDISSYFYFICNGCKFSSSGMRMMTENRGVQLDIGCALLPQKIKHAAHDHPLTRVYYSGRECTACHHDTDFNEIVFGCDRCDVYLHGRCALKPNNIRHPWDPHPLTLVMNFDRIEDHPHDFSCEFCSQVIDPNAWFYHCSDCDASFHIYCIDLFYKYSHIKFGTCSIDIDQQMHEHGLTLVLNKRKRCCTRCGVELYNPPIYAAPVLECTPCNFIICMSCVHPQR